MDRHLSNFAWAQSIRCRLKRSSFAEREGLVRGCSIPSFGPPVDYFEKGVLAAFSERVPARSMLRSHQGRQEEWVLSDREQNPNKMPYGAFVRIVRESNIFCQGLYFAGGRTNV